ncbi:DUF2306 domain-containing protein [Streptomyces sp. MST-110588]|uniref:DUF2306 domain-containing protein n=1 Tax=Streptomyces sp. MST-110588 TaxID=2833628 RepID=UPI001F5CC0C1|nr:DUF2306 domain-containing protein [Streptomyces sp. MST-110588]UNO41234.1 DUF2306 domain-containing protein [Streptomyces sp. MST-110588]
MSHTDDHGHVNKTASPAASTTPDPPFPARKRRRRTSWRLLAIAAVTLLVTALALRAYIPPDMRTSRVPPRSDLHYTLLLAHIFTASLAAAAGCAQFWPWLRRRHPAVHRWTGRAYFFAGVFPSALIGVPVALLAPTGVSNQLALGTLDVLWAVTGVAGYRAARQRRYAAHRTWMIRNFAVTLVAISSRVLQPVIEHLVAARMDDRVSYAGDPLAAAHDVASAGAWLPIIVNLVIAEACIQRRPAKRPRPSPQTP